MKKRTRVLVLLLVFIVAMSLMVTALATSGQTMGEQVKEGFQTAATDTIDMMLAIVPIGLSVFVLVWGIKKAMVMLQASAGGGK